jgi:CRP/FNR family transcriptional regulator
MKIHADKELIRKKVTAQILKNADLFSGLNPDELELISSICTTKKYNKNEVIFTSRKVYSGFFYIADGIVKVYNISPQGEKKVIHIFHKGETFAEVPAFEKPSEVYNGLIKFPADAVCLKNSSKIIHIPVKEFIDLIKKNSNISFRLLSGLSKNLKALQTRNFNLKFQDADRRLLNFLLTNIEAKEDLFKYCNIGESDEIILKISKNDLAAYIGTAQASLSRIFKKFSDLNLMEIRGKKITIINKNGLMNYLNG